MPIDPGVGMPLLAQKPLRIVPPGNSSLPYLTGQSRLPRVKRDDQKEHLFFPFLPIITPPEIIINGATIPLIHSAPNFNPRTDWFDVTIWLRCLTSEHGYSPDEEVTPSSGISFQVSEREILVHIEESELKVIKKNGNRKEAKISANRWNILARGLFFVSSLE